MHTSAQLNNSPKTLPSMCSLNSVDSYFDIQCDISLASITFIGDKTLGQLAKKTDTLKCWVIQVWSVNLVDRRWPHTWVKLDVNSRMLILKNNGDKNPSEDLSRGFSRYWLFSQSDYGSDVISQSEPGVKLGNPPKSFIKRWSRNKESNSTNSWKTFWKWCEPTVIKIIPISFCDYLWKRLVYVIMALGFRLFGDMGQRNIYSRMVYNKL